MSRRRRVPGGPDGVVLVDKPAGPTSAAIVDWIRWALGGAKAGHCGTLDPAATGLMVVALGRGTRWVEYLSNADKTYRARFVLGRSTDTADAEGATVRSMDIEPKMLEAAAAVVRGWVGTHVLPPPAYSAVRTGGQRAYVRARAGEEVNLPPRPMAVHRVADVEIDPDTDSIHATLEVSKGTYIRSLAEALGDAAGQCPAHLGGLRRLASGPLSVDDPRTLAEIDVAALPPDPRGKPRHRIRALEGLPTRAGQAETISGRIINIVEACPLPLLRVGRDDELTLGRLAAGQRVPRCDAPALVLDEPRWALVGPRGVPLLVIALEGPDLRAERTVLPLPVEVRDERVNTTGPLAEGPAAPAVHGADEVPADDGGPQ